MTVALRSTPSNLRRRAGLVAVLLSVVLGVVWTAQCLAQAPAATTVPAKPVTEQGVRWSGLKPAQQAALKPLEHEWPGIDARSKRKWLELSTRFPKLSPAEQARVQERLTEWAKLTPRERGETRLHFQEAKQVPAQDRRERWKAYEALSPEQKRQLAARAAPHAEPARQADLARARDSRPQTKSNIVPNPEFAVPPRTVAPTVLQARPGATTTLITRRPSPPRHQQTGLPKITATPEFVNKATLLPQRGPQGAATRSAAAPANGSTLRQ